MNCPICTQELSIKDDYFYCPQKHGVLLGTKHLINRNIVEVEDFHETTGDTKIELVCPKCSSKMHKTNYNSTEIIIDSCTKCHSRWLDSGEFTKIKNYKPNLTSEQLLHLLDIDRTMNNNDNEMDNTIPGYAEGVTGGLGRILSSGDEKRTLGWISAGAIYGVIRTFVKGNKYQKIVLSLGLVLFIIFMIFLWNLVKANY